MRVTALIAVLLMAAGGVAAQQGPAQFSNEWYQQFRGAYSAPVEPFKIVGNIHYVGGANIASYLITTPQGHILIDTGMKEMHEVIKNSVAKLGFRTADIKIMLSSHAHFDHIEGHAMMQKLTGAQVMAMVGDAEALSTGKDNSALGAIGWEPVKVDRVLKHGDTVSLGGTTLRAVHTPGHTQGATTWITTVEDNGRRYTVIGVAPAGFAGMSGSARVWPLYTAVRGLSTLQSPTTHQFEVVARLTPSATPTAPKADMVNAGRGINATGCRPWFV